MAVRVAINGFGRIGRTALRTAFERELDVEFVGLNDMFDPEMLAHLLKYDTVYGPVPGIVEAREDAVVVNGQAIPAFKATSEVRSAVLRGPLFGIHVSSLLFAYASFALAFVMSITYVLLFKEIKSKHLGVFYARMPSLQVLDQMNQRAIVVGWVFLTIGLVFGVIFAAQAHVPAMSIEDPKIFVAVICWVVYSFELFAARRIGWAGRKMAHLSAIGFAIVLLNFVLISYFTSSHKF